MTETTTETERKFIVVLSIEALLAKYRHQFSHRQTIKQCYLPDTGDWAARIRHIHVEARDHPEVILTLKRKITDETCIELEARLHERQYQSWKEQCGPEIRKTRYVFEFEKRVWYVDHFTQPEFDNLVIAEVEYKTEGEHIDLPPWVGREVTSDPEYRNFKLVGRLG
jgi:adenylate cyclase